MKLSKSQIDKLWGENGPYTEVNLTIQTRVLDDSVSRIFAIVEANVNPLTYEIIKDNLDKFKKKRYVRDLIDHARYISPEYGYKVSGFEQEMTSNTVLQEAQKAAELTVNVIIELHEFVMDLLGIKSTK